MVLCTGPRRVPIVWSMSALDGWIDVCRAGTWRDMAGREVGIDEARLDRIVAAHGAGDPAPVVVGHPETDAPAFAWIDGLRRSGDRLQARLRDIAPAFREAVEAGRYAGRSIALQGDTLRHLGFLGGRAPAVPGLAPTQFAARPETVILLAEVTLAGGMKYAAAWGALARMLRGMRERIIAADGQDAADAAIPDYEIEALAEIAREAAEAGEAAGAPLAAPATAPESEHDNADNGTEGAMPKTEAELAAEAAELDERRAALDRQAAEQAEQQATLDARDAAGALAERQRAAEAALAPHIEAGRVLPAEQAGLAALLASLPDGENETIAFAGPEGSGEIREAPRAVFERFLAALPRRVEYRTLAGGPAPAAPGGETLEDAQAIGAEAHALATAARARGETITTAQAVDQVRAKRGLPTGGGAA